ncbi:MAG: flagellar hook-length control protein FliK [Burkholderiales bacterium]|nr:flagellar hook-length control protein FliK [Burkholderiales bacterium]
MIPANAPLPQLQAYSRVAEPTAVQVTEVIQGLEQLFTVGEQVRALVTDQLPTGRFAVLVKDQLLDLNLPRNTQEGQTLDMQVLATSPRLTFLLTRGAADATALQSALLPSQETTGPGTSNIVQLSDTARFLGGLLAGRDESGTASKTAATAGQPIIETPNLPPAAQIAARLADALSQTGVFYESHLADWVAGSRTLEQVLAEPQALLQSAESAAQQKPAVATPADAAQLSGHAGAEVAASPAREAAPGGTQAAATMQEAVRTTIATLGQEAKAVANQAASSLLDNMPAAAKQIVQQQLQVLDQRQVVWQGQAWPGQPMRWEVDQDGRQQGTGEADAQGTWWTRLQLSLPKLGQVDAVISLSNRMQVDVRFQVSDPATADKILTSQGQLQLQLESAGLKLVGNQVALTGDATTGIDESAAAA